MKREGHRVAAAAVRSIFLAVSVLGLAMPLSAKRDKLTRIPGAELLTGWPPVGLAITGPAGTQVIQNDPQSVWRITPGITPDGRLVASARDWTEARATSKDLVAAVWSVTGQHWKNYAALEVSSGAIAISPDGSKLACVTRWRHNAPSRLEVLDRQTGRITVGPEIWEEAGTDISWSPDSLHLAFDVGDNGTPVKASPTPLRAIYVMDAETGAVRRIGKGVAPAWSPSGEWIAFLDYLPPSDDATAGFAAPRPNRVEVMRPGGSDVRVLATYARDQGVSFAPVWLPDSRSILIQPWHDERQGEVDGSLLDVSTGQAQHVFKASAPVYAWLPAKPNADSAR